MIQATVITYPQAKKSQRYWSLGIVVFFCTLSIVLCWLWPTDSLAAKENYVEVVIEGEKIIIIRADTIEHDEVRGLTRFLGHVSLVRDQENITANQAVWHNNTRSAELDGNIRLTSPNFTLLAERALVNLDLSIAKIYNGRAFFPKNNYYLSGEIIERLGEKEFEIEDGTATTCNGPTPAWTIHADHLSITEGGYASATGVIFKGMGSTLPFFATPYFLFPVKNERQSGILRPTITSSTHDGLKTALPIFWTTGENHDLTFTPIWRQKRGLAISLEGRYHLERSRGIWQVSHLRDHDPKYYNYINNTTNIAAKERFWLRAQNQWNVNSWDLTLNVDLASDPLLLYEFASDQDGFNQTNMIFSQTFGHTVNEALDPNRTTELYAQKLNYDTQIRGGLYYTQNLYQENNRDTIQRLPALQYDIVSRSLSETNNKSRFSLGTRYDYFYRNSSPINYTDETSHRLWLNPSLNWTVPVSNLAILKLDGDLELTTYAASGHRPVTNLAVNNARHDNLDNCLTGSMEAEISTTFNRIFDGGPGQAMATRHQLTPTITLNYIKAPHNQGNLPYWDLFDRRLPRQTARYGLQNTLVSKTETKTNESGEIIAGYDYFQFLKFGLWTSYEFANDADLTSDLYNHHYNTNYYGRGSGPLEVELEAFFNSYLSAKIISAFDSRNGNASSHDASVSLGDLNGDKLTLTYDYNDPKITFGQGVFDEYQEIRSELTLFLNSEWKTRVFTRFDINSRQATETNAQLIYQAQCYGLGLIYSKTYDDQAVGLIVDLLGLGTIGFENNEETSNDSHFFY
ncbi:MAG: hypothetical protein AMR96_02340 [Candidatus Adiutrix intracellularis]|nr:MAG: hypothetical protein AMR96_02340 [Candidatus Adiutrix intracellularis]MDR2827037.1 hypothetical protein [Candidatus Adiutrix intracellularis]